MPRFRGGPPCDELGPGDGVDPRLEPKERKKVTNRKALQLCSQVAEALNLALADSADNSLRNCTVDSVIPNPDSMHLLVNATCYDDKDKTLVALQTATGWLRNNVATYIHRKKVPELRFNLSVSALDSFVRQVELEQRRKVQCRWAVGYRDRGMDHGDYAVIMDGVEGENGLVAECANRLIALRIVELHNNALESRGIKT